MATYSIGSITPQEYFALKEWLEENLLEGYPAEILVTFQDEAMADCCRERLEKIRQNRLEALQNYNRHRLEWRYTQMIQQPNHQNLLEMGNAADDYLYST